MAYPTVPSIIALFTGPFYRTGPNQEIFSFHPGGANILFGDGGVRFLKDSTNVVVPRRLFTLRGQE
jgi:prepilin-type processing-associated H-X9-DG protein